MAQYWVRCLSLYSGRQHTFLFLSFGLNGVQPVRKLSFLMIERETFRFHLHAWHPKTTNNYREEEGRQVAGGMWFHLSAQVRITDPGSLDNLQGQRAICQNLGCDPFSLNSFACQLVGVDTAVILRTPLSGPISSSFPKPREFRQNPKSSYWITKDSSFPLTSHRILDTQWLGVTSLSYGSWMECFMVLPRKCQGTGSALRQEQIPLAKSAFSSTSTPRASMTNRSRQRECCCQTKYGLLGPLRDWHRKVTACWHFHWQRGNGSGRTE